MKLNAFAKFFRKYFFAPPECIFCGNENCSAQSPVCDKCFNYYTTFVNESCADCGDKPIDCSCFTVKNCAAHFHLFNYGHPMMRKLIYRFKSRTNKDGARLFARLLVEMIDVKTASTLSFDCISFVPRSRSGKLRYGFDQGEELARQFAEILGVPCERLLVSAGKATEQKRLSRAFRGVAARTRFDINRKSIAKGKLPYKNVLLVDDILTTGSSMGECARLLKENGVKRVFAAFIARTPSVRR